ncbi:MAG: peptidylprolyl isomerase [Atopobium sp.]|uniref:peptidylprolyl isomerase n=1 Tax=Atopobium sp. TaxID=1872650 RepID=UPI002A83E165|nr:peptidylprolyl isomerase [Atopobium sp.]MDY4523185.1 peptidylprolyl isomerase [Atopobium sp.]
MANRETKYSEALAGFQAQRDSRSGLDFVMWIMAIIVSLSLIFLCACASNSGDKGASSNASQATTEQSQDSTTQKSGLYTPAADDIYAKGMHHATIEVANYGTIELELNADAAPITVSNFCHLANDGFYNGLTFHRIIKDFMVQGGDPNGNGTGGSSQHIKGEFSSNGVVNPIQHKRGVISMARSTDADSASSQFFIMQKDTASLDGQYAAFGQVTNGMDVVDALCAKVKVQDNNGTVASADQPVITKITITD